MLLCYLLESVRYRESALLVSRARSLPLTTRMPSDPESGTEIFEVSSFPQPFIEENQKERGKEHLLYCK